MDEARIVLSSLATLGMIVLGIRLWISLGNRDKEHAQQVEFLRQSGMMDERIAIAEAAAAENAREIRDLRAEVAALKQFCPRPSGDTP